MEQDQGQKAADKSVYPVANDNVHPLQQTATLMQLLMIGDGSEESQTKGGNDPAQIVGDSIVNSTTPTEPNPRDIISARPSVGQADEEAATAEHSVASEATGEADDTLPELIPQEDEVVGEMHDQASAGEDQDQLDNFQESQQYSRGGPLDIDPSDRRLDYKERAQKAEMEVEELERKLQTAEKRIRELERDLGDCREGLEDVWNNLDHQANHAPNKTTGQAEGGKGDCQQCRILKRRLRDNQETLRGYLRDYEELRGYLRDYEDTRKSHADRRAEEDRDYVASSEDVSDDDGDFVAPDVEVGSATEKSRMKDEKEKTDIERAEEKEGNKETEH